MAATVELETSPSSSPPPTVPPGWMIPTVHLPGTFADYLELERAGLLRHEFHGTNRIVAMAGGTPSHGRISGNVFRAVGNRLDGTPCEAFNEGTRVKVERIGKTYYPDVSAACGGSTFVEDRGTWSLVNPVLVVEIISPSTEQADRREKFNHYFMIDSLREYVIIEQDEARATVFGRDTDGNRRFEVFVGLDAILKLMSVNVEIPIRDLYRNVVLPPAATDDARPAT